MWRYAFKEVALHGLPGANHGHPAQVSNGPGDCVWPVEKNPLSCWCRIKYPAQQGAIAATDVNDPAKGTEGV